MHAAPRSIYDHDVDFRALALVDADFKAQQLTKSLLKRDFGLEVELPDDRLCPPVPNRGTGASCIYPLLGCAQRPKWKFIATDIDPKNHHFATQNIARNNLTSRIRPLLTKPEDPFLPLDALGIER
ncbi:MAG: hypothetical protein LQ350_006736 [Teloschistes chrysophthalmus]|nr:MAG: hypothetical protein LQ350_006736 [Niorma chrysophthalma]